MVFPCGTEGYPNTIIHNWSKDHVDVRTTDGYKADRITYVASFLYNGIFQFCLLLKLINEIKIFFEKC